MYCTTIVFVFTRLVLLFISTPRNVCISFTSDPRLASVPSASWFFYALALQCGVELESDCRRRRNVTPPLAAPVSQALFLFLLRLLASRKQSCFSLSAQQSDNCTLYTVYTHTHTLTAHKTLSQISTRRNSVPAFHGNRDSGLRTIFRRRRNDDDDTQIFRRNASRRTNKRDVMTSHSSVNIRSTSNSKHALPLVSDQSCALRPSSLVMAATTTVLDEFLMKTRKIVV